MHNCNALENHRTRRILLTSCAAALAVALMVSMPRLARADEVTPPAVPANLQVPAGNEAFLVGHAVGTQNDICLPCPNPITTFGDVSRFRFRLCTLHAAGHPVQR